MVKRNIMKQLLSLNELLLSDQAKYNLINRNYCRIIGSLLYV